MRARGGTRAAGAALLAAAGWAFAAGCAASGAPAPPASQAEAFDRVLALARASGDGRARLQRYRAAAGAVTAAGVVEAGRRDFEHDVPPRACRWAARLFWEREAFVAMARALSAGARDLPDPRTGVWKWLHDHFGGERRYAAKVRELSRGFTVVYREADPAVRRRLLQVFGIPAGPRPLHPEDFARIVLAE